MIDHHCSSAGRIERLNASLTPTVSVATVAFDDVENLGDGGLVRISGFSGHSTLLLPLSRALRGLLDVVMRSTMGTG